MSFSANSILLGSGDDPGIVHLDGNWSLERVTDNTRRRCPLTYSKIPSSPQRGPCSTLTLWPICKNGQGRLGSPDRTAAWMAAISASSMGIGHLPIPTTLTTLRCRKNREPCGSNRQKT